MKKNSTWNLAHGVRGWEKMLNKTQDVKTILECGCNIGRNLYYLEKIDSNFEFSVIDVNKDALDHVKETYTIKHDYHGRIEDSDIQSNDFDLVFTCGVLIHIHPDELLNNLKKVYSYSSKYILIAEYFNRTPVMIPYQGRDDLLFKRDFGDLFQTNFDVKLLDYGFLWSKDYEEEWDDITWWLFEKN